MIGLKGLFRVLRKGGGFRFLQNGAMKRWVSPDVDASSGNWGLLVGKSIIIPWVFIHYLAQIQ